MSLATLPGACNVPYFGRTLDNAEGGFISFYKAGAAISLKDVVMIDTAAADQVLKATSAGQDRIVGVCIGRLASAGFSGGDPPNVPPDWDNGPSANQTCIVQILGTVSVVSGAAITIGDKLIPDTATAGRVITGVVFVAPYVHIVGKALQTATGAAQTIRCQLTLS